MKRMIQLSISAKNRPMIRRANLRENDRRSFLTNCELDDALQRARRRHPSCHNCCPNYHQSFLHIDHPSFLPNFPNYQQKSDLELLNRPSKPSPTHSKIA